MLLLSPCSALGQVSPPADPPDASADAEAPSSDPEPADASDTEPAEDGEAEPAEESEAATEEPATEEPVEPEPEPEAEQPEDPFAAEEQSQTTTDPTFEAAPAALPPARLPTPFDQHSIRVGGSFGASSDYIIFGIGAGYFVLNGLEVGLDTTFWVAGDPFISTLTPGVRYVFHMVPTVKPYVGGFYRHYFVSDHFLYSDSDSIGARAGLLFMLGTSAFLGGGVIYEHFLDTDLYLDKDQFYPEIIIGFSF